MAARFLRSSSMRVILLLMCGCSAVTSQSPTNTLCPWPMGDENFESCSWSAMYDYPQFRVDNLGENITLLASNYSETPWGSEPDQWILNDLKTVVDLNWNSTRARITEGGWAITIVNVNRDDLGLYNCIMKTPNGTWWVLRVGLNMKGPYFEDLWEKYEMNTIIGLSSAGGFLVLCLLIWAIYRFRWVDPDAEQDPDLYVYQGTKPPVNEDYEPGVEVRGKANHGYSPDESRQRHPANGASDGAIKMENEETTRM